MAEQSKGWLRRIWSGITTSRVFLSNVLFLIIIAVIISALIPESDIPLEKDTVLQIKLEGEFTDRYISDDFASVLVQSLQDGDDTQQVVVYDLVETIKNAAGNPAISAISLVATDQLIADLSKITEVAHALRAFKQSGKPIIAYADMLRQNQYFLAAQADRISLNPEGMVELFGLSRQQLYFARALNTLDVNVHVYRVGEFKSAVEPFLRNDMSKPAKEANLLMLNSLWRHYKSFAAQTRGLPTEHFDQYANEIDELMAQNKGDIAKTALAHALVDELVSYTDWNAQLIEQFGHQSDDKTQYKHIDWKAYHSRFVDRPHVDFTKKKVAVIVAQGEIVEADDAPDVVSSEKLIQQIQQVRKDDNIKALVLRVDSPGGSAFASEAIRDALTQLQDDGIPLIVSMGHLAASGGYLISATADQIWAYPSTITGSIGVFGALFTFERIAEFAGVTQDGVGTNKLANGISVLKDIPEAFDSVIQQSVENTYEKFVSTVAKGRGMSPPAVKAIAEGRIWDGKTAKDIGLVDHLGTFNDAIKAAATAANLEDYDIEFVKPKLEWFELLMLGLTKEMTTSIAPFVQTQSWMSHPVVKSLQAPLKQLERFNDPNYTYMHCMCEVE